MGERIARDRRGLLSRPTVAEVYRYRAAIDDRMEAFLERADDARARQVRTTFILGLNHEQQHQELILTDLKHALGRQPAPARSTASASRARGRPRARTAAAGSRFPAGSDRSATTGDGFAFDNETPRHPSYRRAFALADRLVTNGEYLAFIEDGGYDRPEFWLSDGWNARQPERLDCPALLGAADGGSLADL